MEEKIKFYFPTKELQKEDYYPIDITILSNYYKNSFFQLIDKVSLFLNLNIDGR
jgi:hypothetical protein